MRKRLSPGPESERKANRTRAMGVKGFQVQNRKLVAFIAARDLRRAKEFYRDTLGLDLVSEDEFALVFDVSGTMLRVTRVEELTAAKYTVLGWQVDDIASAAKQLRNAHITLERYPGMEQDELGIWNSPSGAKVAWFKDPDEIR
jgi:catechol 2,3-dioxygenase-like lactoylglutathione lyase family enzyme